MRTKVSGHVGSIDRLIRVVAGLVLVGFALFCPWAASFGPMMQWVSGVIGSILLVTAAVRFCPIYRALGLCS